MRIIVMWESREGQMPAKEHPCSECWLIDFVPAEKRGEAIPCHHIPLNHRGDTVEALGGPCDDPEVKIAMRDWLRRTIQQTYRGADGATMSVRRWYLSAAPS